MPRAPTGSPVQPLSGACYRLRKSFHLGDRWARLNYALRLIEAGERFAISLPDPLAFEIAEVLDLSALSSRAQFVAATEHPSSPELSRRIDTGDSAYRCRYFLTHRPHLPVGRQIGYCFSATWKVEEKVPPGAETIVSALHPRLPGWEFVPLGRPHQNTVVQLVETLSALRLLLCVDNGVAHVARSVGTPLFLLEHRWPVSRGFPPELFPYTRVTKETAAKSVLRFLLGEDGELASGGGNGR